MRREVAKEMASRHSNERNGKAPVPTTTITRRTGGPYRWTPGAPSVTLPPSASTLAPSTVAIVTTTPTPSVSTDKMKMEEEEEEEEEEDVESRTLTIIFSCAVALVFLIALFWGVFKSCHQCFSAKRRFSERLEEGNPNRMARCMGYNFKMKNMRKKKKKGDTGEEEEEEEEEETTPLAEEQQDGKVGRSMRVVRFAANNYRRLQESTDDAETVIVDVEMEPTTTTAAPASTTTAAAATTTAAASVSTATTIAPATTTTPLIEIVKE